MASMVTSAPFSSRRWSSSGMAVISLDLTPAFAGACVGRLLAEDEALA
jgi:hypothetical protein